MRNITKQIPLIFVALAMASCGQTATSSTPISSLEESSITSTEVSSDTEETSSSSKSVEEAKYWSVEVDSLLEESLGKYIKDLPVLTADSYIASNIHNETYDIDVTTIYCFGNSASTMAKTYKAALTMYHFQMTLDEKTNFYSGLTRVADDSLLCLSYGAFQRENEQGVVISCWIQHDKYKEFPQDDVYDFLYEEVPEPSARYYAHSIRQASGMTMLEIDCYDINLSDYHAYATLLDEQGFDVVDYGDAYSAIDPKQYYGIQFSYYSAEESIEVGFEGDMSVMVMLIYLMK